MDTMGAVEGCAGYLVHPRDTTLYFVARMN
jgi:hypothetical protein